MKRYGKTALAAFCGLFGAVGSVSGAEAALEFRYSGSRVEMATGLYPALTNLTLSAWIKSAVKPASGSFGTIAGRGCLYSTNGFGLFLAGDGKLTFQTRTGATALEPSTNYVFDGKWHHVAGVRDGNTSRLYLDGVLADEKTGALPSLSSPGIAFGLGARHNGWLWEYPFNGFMAEVRLWDHARTQAQIQDGMFRRLSSSEAGLAGYWPLDEGAGMTATDRSTGGRNGTLANIPLWLTDATAALLPVSRDSSRQGYWPFTVADLETGSTRRTDSNAVSVVSLQVPAGYDLYQLSASPTAAALSPGAWVSVGTPAGSGVCSNAAEGKPIALFTWFTNSVGSVPLRRSGAAITYMTAGPGVALDFNHASARVEMAANLFPALTNLTLSVWVKTATVPPVNNYGSIAGRGYLAGNVSGFGLFISYTGSVSFQTRDHDITNIAASVAYPFDNTWHHLAGVREGEVTRLYLDGSLVSEKTGKITTFYTSGVAFGLGARHNTTSWGYPFTGAMGEVQLWDHARTQAQIQEDMFKCLGGAETGLIGYWPLNEGKGPTVADWSASCNNGTRTSTAYWTTDVTFGTMLSATDAYLGYKPFALADLKTGDTRLSASNVVAVAGFPVPENCNVCQITASPAVSAIDPGGWIPTNTPPTQLTLSTNAGRVSVFAWFTNTAASVPLRRSAASIVHFPVEAALEFRDASSTRAGMAADLYPGLTNLTLSAWIKTSTRPAANSYGCIAGRGYLYGWCGFGLFLAGDGKVYFQTRTFNTTILQPCTNFSFDGKWHHLAGVRDATATRLYVDGLLVSQTNGTHTTLNTEGVAFGLGARDDGWGNWGYFFDGALAEVRLWNGARSQAQIQAEMFQCLSGTEPGLVGYWPLSEGSGTAVTDRTEAGNNGTRANSSVWLTDKAVSALLPASRDPTREGYWPFTLADLDTGVTRYTDSNVVAVAGLPVPAGCGAYQIGASADAAAIDPGAWLPAGTPPGLSALTEPAEGKPSYLYAWFTNTSSSVPLRRAGAPIVYAPFGGPALIFSNASTRVEMAKNLFPALTNLTLETWVKTSTAPSSGSYGSIAGRGYLCNTNGFGLYVSPDGKVTFQVRTGPTTVSGSAAYPFGADWHHLAGVREGNTTRLYIDGELAVENTGALTSIYSPGVAFGLGARHNGATWDFFFNGSMAEVRLWDCARSARQIQVNRFYRLTGAEAGLIGYWPLDEGEGRQLDDWTSPGNDTRVSGDAWVFNETFRRERPPQGLLLQLR